MSNKDANPVFLSPCQLDAVSWSGHGVLRFQIAVHDALPANALEGIANLRCDADTPLRRELDAVTQHLTQQLPLDPLEDDIEAAARIPRQNPSHPKVVQGGTNRSLSEILSVRK